MSIVLRYFLCSLFVTILASPISQHAIAINLERDINDTGEYSGGTLIIPYVFYNDSTEFAVSTVLASAGKIQPQMNTIVNAFVSSNESYSGLVAITDAQIPMFDRVFVDGVFMVSQWGEVDSYQDGNPLFPDERAGSSTSSKSNFIVAEGEDSFVRLNFRIILPIGHGRGNPIHEFRTINGLLAKGYEAGGVTFNPLTSGRTTIEIEPFYRDQDFEDEFDNDFAHVTSGVKVALLYDNTDWYKNPSYGSKTRVSWARDWGEQEKSNTWTAIQFEYSKYIPLATNEDTLQRVLALNFWTSNVPTADSYHIENGEKIFHGAPLFEGSTLGGIDRQRGFATSRFHDQAAINYSAEYRHLPSHNPFPSIPIINKLYIPWWQIVGFIEVGTVADNWSISSLHNHMKVSAGAGVRVSVSGLVIRVDFAASEDGGEAQMFFGHTF